MKIPALVLVLLIGVNTPLLAQELKVRSGQHANFARLVVPLPEGAKWRVSRTEDTATLTLPNHQDGFDLGAVYQRILRTRIPEIEATETGLVLSLGCDCDVAVFPVGSRYLAIDVADKGQSITKPLPIVDAASTAAPSPGLPPWPTQLDAPQDLSKQASSSPKQADPAKVRLEAAELGTVKRQLARKVATAASRGLLQPSVDLQTTTDANSPIGTEAVPPSPVGPLRSVLPDQNIRITSSLDVPLSADAAERLSVSTSSQCPASTRIAVHEWAGSSDFATEIGTARSALVEEFDRFNLPAALTLIQTYLYYGFGAEALAILEMVPVLARKNPELAAIAHILEHPSHSTETALDNWTDCPSDIALWAVLSHQTVPKDTMINADAALRALNKLPLHLRNDLAPKLSKRFLDHGDAHSAAMALRSLERLQHPLPGEALLAQADLDIESGNFSKAGAGLEDMISQNSNQSPRALIKLVQTRIAADQEISEETAALVDTYVFELGTSELGPALFATQIKAQARSGQFDAAFRNFQSNVNKISASEVAALNAFLITEIARAAPDIVFLDHFFGLPNQQMLTLEADALTAAAQRLVHLGFAEQAQITMTGIALEDQTDEQLILNAEIAVLLEQPYKALVLLENLDTPNATKLRARSKELIGAHQEASELYHQAEAQADANRVAWLAEDWSELVTEDDQVLGPMVAINSQSYPLTDDPQGMLSRSQSALDDSASARVALMALLASDRMTVSAEDEK